LGNGTLADSRTPVNVKGLLSNVMFLSAGDYSVCADTTPSGEYCWGENSRGQLGNGTTLQRLLPEPVIGLGLNPDVLFAGIGHTCVRLGNGEVQCWGANDAGQLGDGTTEDRSTPVYVHKMLRVVSVQAGDAISCALTTAGEVKCWGRGQTGVLGRPACVESAGYCPEPVLISGFAGPAAAIAVGERHACAFMGTGQITCWGSNTEGQLGDGTHENRFSPVAVIGLPASAG
jgi:alpha-tubulin suppressor-like RCC1 family protein